MDPYKQKKSPLPTCVCIGEGDRRGAYLGARARTYPNDLCPDYVRRALGMNPSKKKRGTMLVRVPRGVGPHGRSLYE